MEILNFLVNNPHLTIIEIAKKFGVGRSWLQTTSRETGLGRGRGLHINSRIAKKRGLIARLKRELAAAEKALTRLLAEKD